MNHIRSPLLPENCTIKKNLLQVISGSPMIMIETLKCYTMTIIILNEGIDNR